MSASSNEAAVAILGDTAAPAVSITAPADQATVTGTITVSATASDNVGVVGVQFQLDGSTLGAERTTAPYTFTWDSSTTSNAVHALSAVARDAAGNRTTATVNVTVSNTSSTLSGIVAAFGFNEGTGSTTQDSSGQGNVGTLAGATWTTNGKFGSALSFDGTSAWVTVADANSLDLSTGMTIEAWINPTAGTGWRAVALKETPGGLAYALYSSNTSSRPDGYVHTTSDVGVSGTAAVPLNAWTHLAVTYDGASLRMYVNGILVKTTAAPGAAVVSGSPLRIGGDSVWGEYFRGLIDEVRVYNRALTGGEIQIDMATPVP